MMGIVRRVHEFRTDNGSLLLRLSLDRAPYEASIHVETNSLSVNHQSFVEARDYRAFKKYGSSALKPDRAVLVLASAAEDLQLTAARDSFGHVTLGIALWEADHFEIAVSLRGGSADYDDFLKGIQPE